MRTRRLTSSLVLGLVLLGLPSAAHAEGYIAPFLGVNFGGDAGCPTLADCEDKRYTYGVSLGTTNALIGFEEEFAYAKNFFGEDPFQSTSVLTAMSNLVVGPRIRFIRPYGVVGIGLIKTRVDLSLSDLTSSDTNLGWNVGGGVELTGGRLGVRGDVRYFHGFQDVDIPFLPVRSLTLDFGRASVALVVRF